MKKKIAIGFVLLLGFSSFRSKSVEDIMNVYRNWVTENGKQLVSTQSKSNIDFQLTYLPNELAVLEEIKDRDKISSKELKELAVKYEGNEEYSLRISTKGVKDFLISQSIDKQDYDSKLYYLIGEITNDFRLVNDQDSLIPVHCDFENNYGTAPFLNFRLVFNSTKNNQLTSKKLIYKDVLFSNETVEYDLSHLIKLTIPQL